MMIGSKLASRPRSRFPTVGRSLQQLDIREITRMWNSMTMTTSMSSLASSGRFDGGSTVSRFSIVAAILVAALATALAQPSAATSDGASLSIERPPSGSARTGVVSVAQPFVSHQSFSTVADNWLELVFLDGTSLAMGPKSLIDVRSYKYDAAQARSALDLAVQGGAVRIISGRYSGQPIDVSVGGANIELLDGA